MVTEENEHHGAIDLTQLVHEPLQVLVGLLDAGEIDVHAGVGVIAEPRYLVGSQILVGHAPGVVAAVVLHGDIEDELRAAVRVEIFQDLLVGCGVCYAGVIGGCVLKAVDVIEGGEAQAVVRGATVPVVGQVGMHGVSRVSLSLKLLGKAVHVGEVVEAVGALVAA